MSYNENGGLTGFLGVFCPLSLRERAGAREVACATVVQKK